MAKSGSFLAENQNRLRNVERILPSQPVMRQFFTGGDADFFARLESVTNSVLSSGSLRAKWDLVESERFSYESLGSGLVELNHLQLLVRLGGYRRILEIGTYIGVSTLFLAEAAGPDGRVVTFEIGEEFAGIARENFRRNGMSERIELRNEDIKNALPALTAAGESYNLIFLDGEKESYGRLLEPLLSLLRPGGLMIVDDVFCNGDALNERPATEKGRGVAELTARVAAMPWLTPVILPMGNGQLMLLKPRDAAG